MESVDQVDDAEGFGTFSFEFPKDAQYPSLPVTGGPNSGVLFPRRGVSNATFAEVRVARRLGAQVEVERAFGFRPRKEEREHDLVPFFKELLAEKQKLVKGTLAYEFTKLMLNGTVGKLIQRTRSRDLLGLERKRRNQGSDPFSSAEEVRLGGASVGNLWIPEWSALIVGRARAWAGEIAAAAGAHLLSTDAFIVSKSADLSCISFDELRAVGGDLREEQVGDAVLVVRARLYAILARADSVPKEKVLAADQDWAVVRVAGHGSRESPHELAETLLRCIAAGEDVAEPRIKVRLRSAESAVRHGGELNEEIEEEVRTKFKWDRKRRLVDRDVNLFRGSTPTVPFESAARHASGKRLAEVRAGEKRPRKRKHSARVWEEARRFFEEGRSLREIVRRTGVARTTLHDRIREEKWKR